jgi:hypothetical protein
MITSHRSRFSIVWEGWRGDQFCGEVIVLQETESTLFNIHSSSILWAESSGQMGGEKRALVRGQSRCYDGYISGARLWWVRFGPEGAVRWGQERQKRNL